MLNSRGSLYYLKYLTPRYGFYGEKDQKLPDMTEEVVNSITDIEMGIVEAEYAIELEICDTN